MTTPAKTRIFKSGNSLALRLPKALGASEGAEMTVREEHGRYIFEPVTEMARKIDLTGIYGSIPGIERLPFEERDLDWDGKMLKGG